MKKLLSSFAFIMALASINIQPVLASQPINIGLAKIKKDDRNVKDFNAVGAGGPINIIITLGNTEGLRFEGDADAIATLISEVKGNTLVIRPQNSWTSWAKKYDGKKITAYVNVKTLKSLTMSGNGKMTVNGKIDEPSFVATLSGSGSITATANVNKFVGTISGSGNLNISGGADEASITISGSGSFTRKDFRVSNLTTVISGSGSVFVNAEDHISAVISGSGNIKYSGNATVDKRVVGSGSISKI